MTDTARTMTADMDRARELRQRVNWNSNEAVEQITQAFAEVRAEEREALIAKLAEVAIAVAWQAGVASMELAGQFVSVLHANPEHIDRFMAEGVELVIDGTLSAKNGCLSYYARDGMIHTPAAIRNQGSEQ